MPRRRSRSRCSGVKKANCQNRSNCAWIPRQGCRSSESFGNVAALAHMLQYATDSMGALNQLEKLNEVAKARAVAKIAAVGTASPSKTAKYAQSPSASLQNSLTALSASAGGLDLPYMRGQQTFRVSPDVAAKAKAVLQASASPGPMSSSLSANPAALAALQRSLSPRSASLRSGDVLSPSVKSAVEQAVAAKNYAALAKMSPGVLSAALTPQASLSPQLLLRSQCSDLRSSDCVGPV